MQRFAWAGALAVSLLLSGPASSMGICVEGTYPPFSDTKPDGTVYGFDVDIARAVCEKIGEPCQMVKVTWAQMIPALTGKQCDAIIASMSNTADRRTRIAFTDTYYKVPVRFVGTEGSGLTDTTEGLAQKIVGVQRGTTNQAFMTAHYPGTLLKLYGNQEHVLLDLTLGRLDAVVGEALQLDVGFLKTPAGQGFAFFGSDHYDPAIQGEGAAIGVRQEDGALRERLNAAIAAIRADGTYQGISQRYFGFDIYGS